jgi:prepilin-type N-terminal cleavage/methylation domain-containing protein
MFIINKRNRDKEGLTLIELLVTIAVIAIVAAISVPVISNVVGSSRDNAAAVMQKQVDSFVAKYDKAGKAQYIENVAAGSGAKSNKRLTGFVDLNGDGDYADENELIETFVVGDEYDIAVSGTTTLEGEVNTVDDITAIAVTSAAGSGEAPVSSNFVLASNGTITCVDADNEETGVIDGITYTKRNKAQIFADITLASTSCTSGIIDMRLMFYYQTTFNLNISHWDTSSVTTMEAMFHTAEGFNQDIGSWDTSNVTNMDYMFYGVSAFNQGLSGWDVGEATHYGNFSDNTPNWNDDDQPKFPSVGYF